MKLTQPIIMAVMVAHQRRQERAKALLLKRYGITPRDMGQTITKIKGTGR